MRKDRGVKVAPSTATQDGDTHRSFLLAVLACLLAICAYASALDGSFVWDDTLLVGRPDVTSLRPLAEYFTSPFWLDGDAVQAWREYYRPLTILSLAVDQAVHQGNATGFHLVNVVLHGLNTLLVFLIARRFGAFGFAAFIAALTFGWFPRNTEAVAWISGRTDVIAAFFSLVGFHHALGRGRHRRLICPAVLLLGLFAKEVALAGYGAVAFLFWKEARGQKQRISMLWPLGLSLFLYGILRASALSIGPTRNELDLGARLLAALEALGRYFVMLVDAWHPRVQQGYLGHFTPWYVVAAVLGTVLVLWWIRRTPASRGEQAALLAAGVAIVLVLHLLPISVNVVTADRFLYLPVALLSSVVVTQLTRISRRCLPVLAVLALSYLPATFARARVWGDDLLFWETAFKEQTDAYNAMSRLGLSTMYAEAGLYEHAISICRDAQAGDVVNYAAVLYNQAVLTALAGELDQALPMLEHSARLEPLPRAYRSIAHFALLAHNDKLVSSAVGKLEQLAGPQERASLEDALESAREILHNLDTPPDTLERKVERTQNLVQLKLHRVAMDEVVRIAQDPDVTADHLVGMLTLALNYGTPQQIESLVARLAQIPHQMDTAPLLLLVAEKLNRSARLQVVYPTLGLDTP